ncbi:MAG TPA: DUF3240 family protein [Pseudomonadales bacterium]
MDTLLVLNVDPRLEEELIDFLLRQDGVTGFTAQVVYGHGPGGHMTLAEQVAGRRKRVQVQVLMQAADVRAVLDGLPGVGRDIVWWQQPVSASGRID